jgi:hypothetical protein
MSHYEFHKNLIFTAYKKVKHYYYYDNTTLVTRKRMGIFEQEHLAGLEIDPLKDKLKFLVDATLDKIDKGDIEINPYVLPKKIKKVTYDIISNYKDETEPFDVERLTILADASVEIHIISTLWVMTVGRFLSNMISLNNYAYKINLDIDEDRDIPWENLKLYEPYFVQYQKWRDEAIAKADHLLEEKRNVTILSLDIKDYFHSVHLNFSKLNKDTEREIDRYYQFSNRNQDHIEEKIKAARYLNKILEKIHTDYGSKLEIYYKRPKKEKSEFALPIGLISSGLLGNYYLSEFDTELIENLNPAYYGRYVDDLMFVFSDLDSSSSSDTSTINTFINKYFIKKNVLEFANKELYPMFFDQERQYIDRFPQEEQNDESIVDAKTINGILVKRLEFRLVRDKSMQIQASKVMMHYFDHRESKAALNIFKMKLEEQRSEFRFLPDEDEISDEFDQSAFSLQYNDSINKFRSIQDFTEDKYGASKFLAKKIFARNFGEKEEDEKTDQQILTFFKDYVAISFYSLWEKVATYFIICERGDNLIRFKRNIELAIARVRSTSHEQSDLVTSSLQKQLKEILRISIAVPLALNPTIKTDFLNKEEKIYFKELLEFYVKPIRKSNLFRQTLVNLPFLNFTKFLNGQKSLLTFNPDFISEEEAFIDNKLGYLAPNYVPFHEVNIFCIAMVINNLDKKKLEDSLPVYSLLDENKESDDHKKMDIINEIPNNAFQEYYSVNFRWKELKINEEELKSTYFNIEMEPHGDGEPKHINIDVKGGQDKDFELNSVNKKIAIANMKVNTKNVDLSIRKKPNVTKARRKEVFQLLNMADKHEADLIVFPEVSIPYAWIRLLAERSHKRYMGIIAGLEHWINNHGFAFNFMVTILPFKVHHYKTSLIKIRLKNHYSPSETALLGGNRLLIPGDTIKSYPKIYDLFHWRKTYFSVYNCFELANISHRSIFKSKVDFLIASEYNSDTQYFSDVAGAWVRDVHCFFIQVNSSDFGDSRLIQPSKSYSKDLIQVKGGLNSTVLVGKLNIEQLREFQYVEHNLQREMIDKKNIDIKPTPPDFDRNSVKHRMENKNLIIEKKTK